MHYRLVASGMILLSFLLGLGHVMPGHDWGGDFAQYIMQAQSIVEGTVPQFLEANRWTMEHSYRPVGPVAYPWGFPLMLAPLYGGWGVNLLLFKSVGVAAWAGVLIAVAYYGKSRHGSAGLLLLAVLAFSPALLSSLNQIGSDIPFMLASTAAIMAMPGWGALGVTWRRGLVLGWLVAAAMLLRTNGVLLVIPLIAAQLIDWLVSGRYRAGVRAFVSWRVAWPWLALAALFGLVSVWLPEGGSSHVGHLAQVTARSIQDNLVYYAKLPLAFYEGVPGRHVICVLTYALAMVGLVARVRCDTPTIFYLAATLAVYLIWPDSMQGLRFLYPLLPFYLSFVLSGYEQFTERMPTGARFVVRAAGGVLAVYVAGAMVWTAGEQVVVNQRQGRPVPEGPYTEASRALFAAVERLTAPDDPVVFFKPRVMRFMTGRPSVALRSMEQVPPGASLVVYRDPEGLCWPIAEQAWRSAMQQGRLTRVTEGERFIFFRVAP